MERDDSLASVKLVSVSLYSTAGLLFLGARIYLAFAKGASLILLTEPYIFIWNFALIHIQCDVANVIPRLFHLFETKTKEGIRIDPFPSMDFCFLVNAQN
jgi:hypothetical protein